MPEEIILRRTGEAPLRFIGTLLAESEGRYTRGKDNSRYHDVRIYRTPSNKLVLHVDYQTHWQGEPGHSTATIHDTPAEVVAALRDYVPTAHLGGFPDRPHYRDRQAALQADLARRYAEQVSDVLLADVFAEEVP